MIGVSYESPRISTEKKECFLRITLGDLLTINVPNQENHVK